MHAKASDLPRLRALTTAPPLPRSQRVKGTDVVLPKSYQVAPEGSVSLETLETTLERSFQRSGLEGAAAAAASVVSSVEGGVESTDVAANAEEHTVHEDLGRPLITLPSGLPWKTAAESIIGDP